MTTALATSSPTVCVLMDACSSSRSSSNSVIGVTIARGGLTPDSNGLGGSNPLLYLGETSDGLGVQLRAMSSPGALHLVSSAGCNAITIESDGTTDMPHDSKMRNLTVYGDVEAERYNNLIGSFTSTNTFVPPSAAALGSAYRTLSNMIVSASFAAGGISNIELDTTCNLVASFLTTSPDQQADIEVDSISTGTIRVAEAGYIDAKRYLNLAIDWKHIVANDIPASAYALSGAFAELSNMVTLSNALEWRRHGTGEVLATLDPATGVFTAIGGYGNLPIASTTSVASPSNTAASVSLAHSIRAQAISLAGATLAKAEYASNTASSTTTLLDARVQRISMLSPNASNTVASSIHMTTDDTLTLSNARFHSLDGYEGLAHVLSTSTDSNTPASAAGVGAAYRTTDARATFGSNLAMPLNMLVATAPARAAQGDWSSNAAGFASNVATCLSNRTGPRALYASNAARWGSNAAVWGSNTAGWGSNASVWGSNAASWGCNSAFFASNAAFFASNLSEIATFSSNTAIAAFAMASYGSNAATSNPVLDATISAATFSSNTAVYAWGTALFASNVAGRLDEDEDGAWASNDLALRTGPRSAWASNSAEWASNVMLPQLGYAAAAAGGSAQFASNAGAWASNAARWTSNATATTINDAAWASNFASVQGTASATAAIWASNATHTASAAASLALVLSGAAQSNAVAAQTSAGAAVATADGAALRSIWSSNAARWSSNWVRQNGIWASNAASYAVSNIDDLRTTASFAKATAVTLSNNLYAASWPTLRWASNAAASGSNLGVGASNVAGASLSASLWASNAVNTARDLGIYASNVCARTDARSTWASNTAKANTASSLYSSNTSVWTSNMLAAIDITCGPAASNSAIWASNSAHHTSNLGAWASNAISGIAWASNVAVAAQASATFATNHALAASNSAGIGLVGIAGLSASNAALTASSLFSRTAASNALEKATWTSNVAAYASNAGAYASNVAAVASNVVAQADASATDASNALAASTVALSNATSSMVAATTASLSANAATSSAATAISRSDWASNAAWFSSNAAVAVLDDASNALGIAAYAYSVATPLYEIAAWTSNNITATSNEAFAATFERTVSADAGADAQIVSGTHLGSDGILSMRLSNAVKGQTVDVLLDGAAEAGGMATMGGADLVFAAEDGSVVRLTGTASGSSSSSSSSSALVYPPAPGAPVNVSDGVLGTFTMCNVLYGAGVGYSATSSSSSNSSSSGSARHAFSYSNEYGSDPSGPAWISLLGYTTSSGYPSVPPDQRGGGGVPQTTVDGVPYSGDWLQLTLPESETVYPPKAYTISPALALPATGVSDGQPRRWVLAGSSDGGGTWTTLDATYASSDYLPANARISVTCPTSTSAAVGRTPMNAFRLVLLRVSVSAASAASALFVPCKICAMRVVAAPTIASLSLNSRQALLTGALGIGVSEARQHLDVAGSAIISSNLGLGGVRYPQHALELATDDAIKPASSTWTVFSDRRLKSSIQDVDLQRCYDIVKTVPLRRYTWREDVYTQSEVSDRTRLGWIAQEVAPAFPKAVTTERAHGLDDCLSLNSDQLIAALYGAVQRLMEIVESK